MEVINETHLNTMEAEVDTPRVDIFSSISHHILQLIGHALVVLNHHQSEEISKVGVGCNFPSVYHHNPEDHHHHNHRDQSSPSYHHHHHLHLDKHIREPLDMLVVVLHLPVGELAGSAEANHQGGRYCATSQTSLL